MKTDQKYSYATIGTAFSIILLLAAWIFYVATSTRIENPGYDKSVYYELAKNILMQKQYVFNYQLHTIYPPGYPLILVAFITIFGDSFGMLSKANAAAGFIGIFGSFVLFCLIKNWKYALIIALLLVFSPLCYFWTTSGLSSDAVYFSLSICLFISMEFYLKSEMSGIKLICFGAVLLLSCYIVAVRSIGVAIIFGFLCWGFYPLVVRVKKNNSSLKQRLSIALPSALLAIVIVGGWTIWAHKHKPVDYSNYYMDSYFTQIIKEDPQVIDSPNMSITDLPARIAKMTGIRGANLIKSILGIRYIKPSLTLFPVFWVIALILTGLIHSLAVSDRVIDWYVLAYAAIIIIYPFNESGRYLFPIFPFLLSYLLDGVLAVKAFLKESMSRKKVAAIVSALALMMVLNFVSMRQSGIVGKQDLLSLALWALSILVIICAKGINLSEKFKIEHTASNSLLRIGSYASLYIILFAVVGIGGYKITKIAMKNMSTSVERSLQYGTMLAAAWINDNTKPNDVIMCEHFAIVHHLTKRKSCRFPLTTDSEKILNGIEKYGVDFLIILDKKRYEYYLPSVEDRFNDVRKKFSRAFCLAGKIKKGKIYKVDKEAVMRYLEKQAVLKNRGWGNFQPELWSGSMRTSNTAPAEMLNPDSSHFISLFKNNTLRIVKRLRHSAASLHIAADKFPENWKCCSSPVVQVI